MNKGKQCILLLIMICFVFHPANIINANAETLPSGYGIYGDLNGDRIINIGDDLLLRRHISAATSAETYQKHKDWLLTGEKEKLADLNANKKIDIGDIMMLQRHLAVINGSASTHPEWRIVTIYLDYGTAVGKSNSWKRRCFSATESYSAHGNIETDLLKDPNYTFIGWYTKPTGGTRVYGTSEVGTSNQILYAHYEKKNVIVTSVSINKSSVYVKVGGQVTLTATVKPSDATNKSVTWSSSNKRIATVSGGKVKGVSSGTAIITAKSNNGKTATCKITVGSYNPAKSLPNTSGLKNPEKLAKVAESQLNYQGTNSKGTGQGDNTVYGAWMKCNNNPWCASFVSWCVKKAGISTKVVPKNATCRSMAYNSINYGKWTATRAMSLKRGDVVFFSNSRGILGSSGHVGVVSSVTKIKKNNKVVSLKLRIVEGNTLKDLVHNNPYTANISTGSIGGGYWKYIGGFISVK